MSLYLSRLVLDPRGRAVRADLADCHQLHRTILRAFPPAEGGDGGARAHFGVLYRVDSAPRGGETTLLVQSRERPDWSALAPGYLLSPADGRENPACKRIDAAYDRIAPGDVYVFRLRANPTRRVKQEKDPQSGKDWSGKRVNLQKEPELHDWLARKGEQSGFRLLAVRSQLDDGGQDALGRVYDVEPVRPGEVPDSQALPGARVRGHKAGAGRLTFGSVLFQGRLQVTEAARFRQALEQGIGSGKAYGFGLLSIAPQR